jgi:chitinase
VQRRSLISVAAAAVAIGGATLVGFVNAQSASAALTDNWYASAPYLMPFDNAPPDPVTVMNATGQKAFQLAFILAGGSCSPTWDGTRPVSSDTEAGNLIGRIRANGGDVSVSIGGFNGTKLGQVCGSPAATAAAYQQVVTKYNLKAMDFDLEEPEYENATAVHNELGAAQILQRDNPGLFVSITTAATGDGTGFFGKALLDDAKSLGFTPNNFSIMPFDGGFNGASAQISALENFHAILMSKFGWDSATAYAREGFSGMNGRSDSAEMFPQSAFESVLSYATSHHLGRFTYWSVNRDRQCDPVDPGRTLGTCSSVPQEPWEFTKFTTRFAGATPPSQPPPPPSTTGPPPACSAPPWSATQVYATAGQLVSFNGHIWKNKWWTQNETPGRADVWADQGACSGTGPPPPPPGPCTIPAWSSTQVYTGGMTASFNGHNWTARWWTLNETPGVAEVWTDNGPC